MYQFRSGKRLMWFKLKPWCEHHENTNRWTIAYEQKEMSQGNENRCFFLPCESISKSRKTDERICMFVSELDRRTIINNLRSKLFVCFSFLFHSFSLLFAQQQQQQFYYQKILWLLDCSDFFHFIVTAVVFFLLREIKKD